MKKIMLFVSFISILMFNSQVASTFAGSGNPGSTDATGVAASFNSPIGVAVDGSGNVYVADYANHKIRKITPSGTVSTLAGSGLAGSTDATGTAARFNGPYGVAVDGSGNVYVTDTGNHKIRKISPSGVVTTLAGTGAQGDIDATGTAASFRFPVGIALDAAGNIYVGDTYNYKIKKITPSGVVSTLAGSGFLGSTDATGTSASFNLPHGLVLDGSGNIYVADTSNHKIRKITPSGVVITVAGSGLQGMTNATGTAASFRSPIGVALDASENIYVLDQYNNAVRKITTAGAVTTLVGNGSAGSADGVGSAARFNLPYGIAADNSGILYVGDFNNHKIRKIDPNATSLSTNNIGQRELSISPNPAKENFTVSNIKKGSLVSLYDMTGRLLFSTKALSATVTIDTSAYQSGVYVLKVDGQSSKLLISK